MLIINATSVFKNKELASQDIMDKGPNNMFVESAAAQKGFVV